MELARLSGMAWISKSIAVAARLGLADLLAERPQTAEALAERTGTRPDAVAALLRALTAMGVFARNEDGTFANSDESEQLRTDHPVSMRYFCMLAGEMYYDAWGGLLHTVQTGEPASRAAFGTSIYGYMDQDPEAGRVYDLAMEDLARPVADRLVQQYDFSGVRRIVDVGGGAGRLLRTILAANPGVEGICADRKDVCERATAHLAASDPALAARLTFEPADFFADLPDGGDLYLLKNVLHNWNPESSLRILGTVRDAMRRTKAAGTTRPGGPALLLIEPLAGTDDSSFNAIRALFQMVICEEGTRHRTEAELLEQLSRSGLAPRSVTLLADVYSVIECELVDS